MVISFAIMHCSWDPLRLAWLELIRAEVPQAVVVDDWYRSCVETARRAWLRARDDQDATHFMVLQDDMLPCAGFAARVLDAVEQRPDHAVSFRRPPSPARWDLYDGAAGFVDCGTYIWGGSVVLPRAHIRPMMAWWATHRECHADDELISGYLLNNSVPTCHFAPELLSHAGADHSLLGHNHQPIGGGI